MVLRAGSLGSVATPPAVSAARGHLAYVVQTIRLGCEVSAWILLRWATSS
jgi:hypothetical protein